MEKDRFEEEDERHDEILMQVGRTTHLMNSGSAVTYGEVFYKKSPMNGPTRILLYTGAFFAYYFI